MPTTDPKEHTMADSTTTPTDYGTAAGRLAAVAAHFTPAFGDLYVDEYHTEPLWDMTYPSAEVACDNDAQACGETARRVAAAIAVMAYGVGALEARAGLL